MSLLKRIIEHQSANRADVQWATYVRPVGRRGKHLVKLICSEEEVAVSGPPDYTLRPGTTVALSSHQNSQSKVMHAFPPAAGRGSSAYAADMFHAIKSAPAPTCPVMITGKSYVGFYPLYDGGPETTDLYAYNYTDGTAGSLINTLDFTALSMGKVDYTSDQVSPTRIGTKIYGVSGSQANAWYYTDDGGSGDRFLWWWDYSANTAGSYTFGADKAPLTAPVAVGSNVYVFEVDTAAHTATTSGDPTVRNTSVVRLLSFDSSLTTRTVVGSGYTATGDFTPVTLVPVGSGFQLLSIEGVTLYHNGASGAPTEDPTGSAVDSLTYSYSTVGSTSSALGGLYGYAGGVYRIPTLGTDSVNTWPAHWDYGDPQAFPYVIPNAGGTQYVLAPTTTDAGTTWSFVRLTLQDYATTDAACTLPSLPIDNIPGESLPPMVLFPED